MKIKDFVRALNLKFGNKWILLSLSKLVSPFYTNYPWGFHFNYICFNIVCSPGKNYQ
jgi:hypothetical protein